MESDATLTGSPYLRRRARGNCLRGGSRYSRTATREAGGACAQRHPPGRPILPPRAPDELTPARGASAAAGRRGEPRLLPLIGERRATVLSSPRSLRVARFQSPPHRGTTCDRAVLAGKSAPCLRPCPGWTRNWAVCVRIAWICESAAPMAPAAGGVVCGHISRRPRSNSGARTPHTGRARQSARAAPRARSSGVSPRAPRGRPRGRLRSARGRRPASRAPGR